MKNNNINYKTIKMTLIMISCILVLFTLTSNMLTSSTGGAVPLYTFESIYVYLPAISMILYLVKNDKNANFIIIIALLTYIWTYYLVNQMIDYITDVKIIIEPFFYIYLSSSIFLFISLFVNKSNKVKPEVTQFQNEYIDDANVLDKNNYIFGVFVVGLKQIPYKSEVLLVNNINNNTLDIFYIDNNDKQVLNVSKNDVKNISFKTQVIMNKNSKIVESHETKSMLLSASVFGGHPMLQLAGNSAFNYLFDEISNNYEKINFNSYYEISIEVVIDNQESNLVINSNINPEEFINQVNK